VSIETSDAFPAGTGDASTAQSSQDHVLDLSPSREHGKHNTTRNFQFTGLQYCMRLLIAKMLFCSCSPHRLPFGILAKVLSASYGFTTAGSVHIAIEVWWCKKSIQPEMHQSCNGQYHATYTSKSHVRRRPVPQS
jgi:hypothetical protein